MIYVKVLLALGLGFFATSSFADASIINDTSSNIEIKCGDHWFHVTASIDAKALKAKVWFGGDAGPDTTEQTANVSVEENQTMLHLTDGSRIRITTLDGTDLPYAYLRETANADDLDIGYCK